MQLIVHHGSDVFHAVIEPAERADRLLLKSLHHFDLDPASGEHRVGWLLRPRGAARGTDRIVLDHPIGEQVTEGDELVLEEDVAGNRRPSTGLY